MTTVTGTSQLSTGTWAIDPAHSSIEFSVRQLMVSRVHGRFGNFSGSITVPENDTPSVTAEVAVDSVNSGNEKRDAHLQGSDFFDAERYPTATFASTNVRTDGGHYLVDGDLTLKGVTKPITLDVAFNGVNSGMGRGEVAHFEASVVLNRKDFGIDTNLPVEIGGTVIGKTATVTLEVEASKQQ